MDPQSLNRIKKTEGKKIEILSIIKARKINKDETEEKLYYNDLSNTVYFKIGIFFKFRIPLLFHELKEHSIFLLKQNLMKSVIFFSIIFNDIKRR